MPQEQSHHPSGPLVLAAALAATAGFVDAHIFLHVTPVFVANQSGNLIHLGMFAGQADWHEAAAVAVAICSFVAGVMAATVHHDHQVRAGRPVHPTVLLAVEAALVLLLMGLLAWWGITFSRIAELVDLPVIIIGGVAMGVQTAALRRVGSVAVSTTYGTGSIVRIGEKSVLALRGADRSATDRRSRTVVVLAAVTVAYVLGAVAASALGRSPWLLLLPVAVLVVAAVATRSEDMSEPVAASDGVD
jgi:uncharacterized membrane protein YoaK (UPF0700 family)